MSEWQPIATAPKDGTEVDLWIISLESPAEACRVPNCSWGEGFVAFEAQRGELEGWLTRHPPYGLDGSENIIDPDDYKATHWMALPEAPTV